MAAPVQINRNNQQISTVTVSPGAVSGSNQTNTSEKLPWDMAKCYNEAFLLLENVDKLNPDNKSNMSSKYEGPNF
ncbi:MAG: hypothetical protein KDK63_00855, partial [Chlamydiia bacterium]|nr:hypothetical protein [Chlamydiia bacterium]